MNKSEVGIYFHGHMEYLFSLMVNFFSHCLWSIRRFQLIIILSMNLIEGYDDRISNFAIHRCLQRLPICKSLVPWQCVWTINFSASCVTCYGGTRCFLPSHFARNDFRVIDCSYYRIGHIQMAITRAFTTSFRKSIEHQTNNNRNNRYEEKVRIQRQFVYFVQKCGRHFYRGLLAIWNTIK